MSLFYKNTEMKENRKENHMVGNQCVLAKLSAVIYIRSTLYIYLNIFKNAQTYVQIIFI